MIEYYYLNSTPLCPKCKSPNITIDEWFDLETRQYKKRLECRDCNYEFKN